MFTDHVSSIPAGGNGPAGGLTAVLWCKNTVLHVNTMSLRSSCEAKGHAMSRGWRTDRPRRWFSFGWALVRCGHLKHKQNNPCLEGDGEGCSGGQCESHPEGSCTPRGDVQSRRDACHPKTNKIIPVWRGRRRVFGRSVRVAPRGLVHAAWRCTVSSR